MRSPTFVREGTPQDAEDASVMMDLMGENSSVGREVSNASTDPRHRKNLVNAESQTENVLRGNKPETPGVVSEPTQSSEDSETIAQHPMSSCTVVNCLVCATIGMNNRKYSK